VGHWNFNLDNTAGRYNGTFSPNLIVDILDDGVRIMKGYLDLSKPLGKETPETKLEEIMAVSGRDYGQDLDNLILDKVYPIQHADDIIADILATVGSEITYTSPGTAPQLSAEGKDDYLITLISGILSQINYDAFVDEIKALQLFAQGTDSGIILKMVEDASDNNIVDDIQFDEADGLEIRNYIKVKGKLIEDGVTEGNANGWTGKPGNVVSNDLADFVYGGASIKCEKGSASECYLKLICPKYNYNSWALTTGNLALSFRTRYNTNPAQFYPISIYLVDSSGNSIFHSSAMTGIADGWNKTSAAPGPDVEIGTGKPWAYNVGSSFDWWHVTEIWILTHSNVDILKIDGLCIPVRMYAFSQDGTSQGLYRVRMIPLERQDIESQVELQAYADDYKAKRKDPMAAIRLTAKAEAGLLGDPKVNKWIPGYKLLVNAPPAGINNVEYMMVDTTYRLSRDAGQGWIRLVDLYLVKNTVKVDKIRWLLAHDPEFAMSYLIREKLKFLQRMEETLATGWMEPPKPLTNEYIGTDISPTKIKLVTGSSLADWQKTGDGAYFDGAKLYLNSVSVQKLAGGVGTRGLQQTRDARTATAQCSTAFQECTSWVSGETFTFAARENARHRLQEVSIEVYVDISGGATGYGEYRVAVSDDGGSTWSYYNQTQFTETTWTKKTITLSPEYIGDQNESLTVKVQIRVCHTNADSVAIAYSKNPIVEKRTSDSYRVDLT
jgi:hypothetical protein